MAALAAAGARVPRVLALGQDELVLERLELRREGDYAELARMLARVHRVTGPRYGWPRDNYIGLGVQANGWCDDWARFWLERRMRPQLALARRKGFDLPEPSLALLDGHHPAPSLLHGDLWSGNAGFCGGRPVLFDPAVYYGDRECDLAMTELFGGFPRAFYEAYGEAYPLASGYEKRKTLYNLYHLLNHLNLFGSSYLPQVRGALRLLLDGL
ncbi:MAG TPA: fructosamine kinase family protein [Burkholderiales bacterium]|nr:fructosamine kinase family protein [Burkholderiales bacterium]